MTVKGFARRKKVGWIIASASLVSLVVIYFYTRHIAEERVAEFNSRDPEFIKKNWALKETGPRNRLGLEVTQSVALIEVKARGPGEPESTPYQGSAVFKSISTGQIWEVVAGRARLSWSPNPLWLITTHPVPVSFALVTCLIGFYFALLKTGGKETAVTVLQSSPQMDVGRR